MTDHERLLSGRTAVVTGGARGLGKAIAKELAARGVNVALLGLEEDALARTATELPTVSRSWPVDITDDDAMVHAAEDVHRLMGPVSIVVANAGVAEAALSSTRSGKLATRDRGQPDRQRSHRPLVPAAAARHSRPLPPDRIDRVHRSGADDECLLRVQSRRGILRQLPACRNGPLRGERRDRVSQLD